MELASRRITVNTVLPGAVETKMLRGLPKEIQESLEQRTPLGVGQPQDVAGLVAYLASEETAESVKGADSVSTAISRDRPRTIAPEFLAFADQN